MAEREGFGFRCTRYRACPPAAARVSPASGLPPPSAVRIPNHGAPRFACCTLLNGGERGIRTPGGVAPTPVFKTGAFDHSAISPQWVALARWSSPVSRPAVNPRRGAPTRVPAPAGQIPGLLPNTGEGARESGPHLSRFGGSQGSPQKSVPRPDLSHSGCVPRSA
jgi:hypothetical protein